MTWWEIFLTVACGIVINEFCDICPWAAGKIVRWSAHLRYGDTRRGKIRAEDQAAYIEDRPGKIIKVITALGFAIKALYVVAQRRIVLRWVVWSSPVNINGSSVGIITAIASFAILACFATTSIYVAVQTTNPTGATQPLVSGRSAVPADIEAPGLQMDPNSSMHVSGGMAFSLSGQDIDTIVASSKVRQLVKVIYDPGFNPPPVTKKRIQYLADRLSGTSIKHFLATAVTSNLGDSVPSALVIFYNVSSKATSVPYLKVALIDPRTNTPIFTREVYGFSQSPIVIPPRSMYFVYVPFPKSIRRPQGHYNKCGCEYTDKDIIGLDYYTPSET